MNLFHSPRLCQSQTLYMPPESTVQTMTLARKAG